VSVLAPRRPCISREEILDRQVALRSLCTEHGWPALAVAGRSAGTFDRHADLMWSCGHYETFVGLHDEPPRWSGRAHAVLVVRADGPTVLLCPTAELGDDVVTDDVRVARTDFAAEAAALFAEQRVAALAGADAIPWSLGRRMQLDGLADAHPALERLRRRKSPGELAVLRHACAIGTRAVDALVAAAVPGAMEGDALAAAAGVVLGAGAALYVHTLSVGDRNEHYAGRPLPGFRAERRMEAGEPARLDLVLVYEGYMCDFGRSWVVGGRDANPAYAEQVDGLRAALREAAAAAADGAVAGDVAGAGARALPPELEPAYPPHWGHGLGMGWDGPWLLPASCEPLQAGMTLAIETTLRGPAGVVAGEEDVLVGAGGAEVLTPAAWEPV